MITTNKFTTGRMQVRPCLLYAQEGSNFKPASQWVSFCQLSSLINMENIKIEKPGEGVFIVKFVGANRAAAERELQEFIAQRPYTRYIDHHNPNNQIIAIHPK